MPLSAALRRSLHTNSTLLGFHVRSFYTDYDYTEEVNPTFACIRLALKKYSELAQSK